MCAKKRFSKEQRIERYLTDTVKSSHCKTPEGRGSIPGPANAELLPAHVGEAQMAGLPEANGAQFTSDSQAQDGDDAAWTMRVALRIRSSHAAGGRGRMRCILNNNMGSPF